MNTHSNDEWDETHAKLCSRHCAVHKPGVGAPIVATLIAQSLVRVTCTVCDELILPESEATADGDRWAHRDCMEAGE